MTAQSLAEAPSTKPRFPTVAEFERGELDPEAFVHEAHVYVAWELINECPLAEAIERFAAALRRLTRALGQEAKYHETITWFFMILTAERQAALGAKNWDIFAGANPDLLTNSQSMLARYYSAERLWSPLARRQFLLPDLAGS